MSQASGTGSNDEILDITVGKKNKKKRSRKSRPSQDEGGLPSKRVKFEISKNKVLGKSRKFRPNDIFRIPSAL